MHGMFVDALPDSWGERIMRMFVDTGAAVTAEDVAWSLERAGNPDTGNPIQFIWSTVGNYTIDGSFEPVCQLAATPMVLVVQSYQVATKDRPHGRYVCWIPKQQILIKRPDIAKVVNLHVDRVGYWLYTNSPRENHRRREVFEQYGFEAGLEVLARS